MAANANAGDFEDLRKVDVSGWRPSASTTSELNGCDQAIGRATHHEVPALRQDPLDQGSFRRGHVEGTDWDGRTAFLGRVPDAAIVKHVGKQ